MVSAANDLGESKAKNGQLPKLSGHARNIVLNYKVSLKKGSGER